MLNIALRVPLHPSEDPKKVRLAVLNLFPDAKLTNEAGYVVGAPESLTGLRALIRKQKILDASRRSLLRSLDETRRHAVFRLNKQAAFSGRVSFADDFASPLGDIEVTADAPDLEDRFKEIAPMTIKGIPVSEERAEEELAKRRARKTAGRATAPDFTVDDAADWIEDEGDAP